MNTTNTKAEKIFLSAVEEHKKKNLNEAASLYDNVLNIKPNPFEYNFYLLSNFEIIPFIFNLILIIHKFCEIK